MVFQLGNIERMLAQVTFLTLMCIIIRTKTYLKLYLSSPVLFSMTEK